MALIALLLWLTGLALMLTSLRLGLGTLAHPGPGFFPFLLSVALLWLPLRWLRPWPTAAIWREAWPPREQWRGAGSAIAGLSSFALVAPILGLLPAIAAACGACCVLDTRGSWRQRLGFVALVTALAWAIFDLGLTLPVPSWRWPF